jgi:Zn-dependent M28 family amino/carboxypeptidase
LANEFVVVGAHFDHLGRGIGNELDTDAANQIRNGADDNASGTAGVMELARLFAGAPTKRSLVFVAFSGEELGLLGSAKFVDEALPAGRIQAMVNFDMIGRLKNDRVIIYGTGTATEMPQVVARANTVQPLQVSSVPDGFGPSDHSSFYAKDIPVLHFFTDLHEDYHKATDDADKINAAGTARVVDLAARAIRDIADRPTALTFVRQAPPVRASSPTTAGARPYLGSVPDMAAGDVPGLKVTGVTPGSPADKGGMKGGDLVVELDGKPVTDLETYTAALYARKAGDTISIVVMRGGQRLTLSVTLGARS